MGRAGLAAVAALAAVFAAGCGGAATPRFGGTPSSSVPDPTTTAVSDPSPPVMPAAARAHTAAGAKAFVEFVIDALNFSEVTVDETALKPLFSDGCYVCQSAPDTIAKIRRRGGVIDGGVVDASNYEVDRVPASGARLMRVTFSYHSTRQTVSYPHGRPTIYPEGSVRLAWTLSPRRDGWLVVGWDQP